MNTLLVDPGLVNQATSEKITWAWDLAPLMASGDALSLPTAALFDVTNGSPGTPVTLTALPTLSGTVIAVTIDGSVVALAAGHLYRLDLTATFSVLKRLTTSVHIRVDY